MEKITDKIQQLPPNAEWFSLEFFPPKTQAGFDNLQSRLARLSRLQPLFVTVTWGAGGSTATRSLELAAICQQQYDLTTCLHLTCTNMRQHVLDDALNRCKELGIKNILALRGDEPRRDEYDLPPVNGDVNGYGDEGEEEFTYAVDLVRYIRRKHGTHFCVGVAAYPEGHATSPWAPSQSPRNDLPYLRKKTEAGADFLMTQLFYDVDAFLNWQDILRSDPSGLFNDIPIVPGLMPVQSWGILARTTNLSCAKIPEDMRERLEQVKGDDGMVKEQGVKEVKGIVGRIRSHEPTGRQRRQGYHFYTLNLEKAVAQILEESALVPQPVEAHDNDGTPPVANGTTPRSVGGEASVAHRRRLSSRNAGPRNRVVVPKPPDPGRYESAFEATEDEAGVLSETDQSRADALATSEGQGSLGREANWDDYPNGRFGDARSPAFGSIDGYGPTLHVTPSAAKSVWGHPESAADLTALFQRYLQGRLAALPWSEEALNAETRLIQDELLQMSDRGWWSVASQPAVNAAPSSDEVVGWGPRRGGWVWQKPFVEFFLPAADWTRLKRRLDDTRDEFVYFAGNGQHVFESNDEKSVNPVTWGAFKGKEIITPTLIEAQSFRAWQEEAFALWREWQRIYPPGSPSAKLISQTAGDVWLVNVIGHEYVDGGKKLWHTLLNA